MYYSKTRIFPYFGAISAEWGGLGIRAGLAIPLPGRRGSGCGYAALRGRIFFLRAGWLQALKTNYRAMAEISWSTVAGAHQDERALCEG